MEDIIDNATMFCPGTNSSVLERSFVRELEDGNLTTLTTACNCTQWNLDTVDVSSYTLVTLFIFIESTTTLYACSGTTIDSVHSLKVLIS